MKRFLSAILAVIAILGLIPVEAEQVTWNEGTRIDEVTSYPAFGDWGRMILFRQHAGQSAPDLVQQYPARQDGGDRQLYEGKS